MTEALRAPFPYFGGKRWIADEVWQRFGDVPNYVEPFAGSAAVLLARPSWHQGHIETINDKDGYVSNFWRATRADPEGVAFHADWPVNENDLHARHVWLLGQRDSLTQRLEGDPEYYDARVAGWWVWGMSCWIGSGFCSGQGPWQAVDGELVNTGDGSRGVNRNLVHLGDGSRGVNRNRVHLGDGGQGVNRMLVHLGGAGQGVGVNVIGPNLSEWFAALSSRLRRVRVCSGDWSRVTGPSVTFGHGLTGVILDPPYQQELRAALYRVEDDVSGDVREWAIENGGNPLMRIALCGYEGEHEMPAGWNVYEWKARGGFGSQGEGRGAANRHLERIWFSPHCQPSLQGALL